MKPCKEEILVLRVDFRFDSGVQGTHDGKRLENWARHFPNWAKGWRMGDDTLGIGRQLQLN